MQMRLERSDEVFEDTSAFLTQPRDDGLTS